MKLAVGRYKRLRNNLGFLLGERRSKAERGIWDVCLSSNNLCIHNDSIIN